MKKSFLLFYLFFFSSFNFIFAGNTGKIAGRVVDAETNSGLPGVNVMILETKQGAITDINGYYVILNVLPGSYTLRASMISYSSYSVSKIEVNIDRTTTVNISMSPQAIQGQEVQVIATRPIVPKDVAASTQSVTENQIMALPVQNVQQVVGLQAGIVVGNSGTVIRGGGEDQTNFVLDGVSLRDERTMKLSSFTKISLNSLQEIQIQTGGFNAEYGNVRSGVINVVTKEGDKNKYTTALTLQIRPPQSKHFGISVYDPMSFWNRPYMDPAVCWTGTKNGAWDQYTQLQYPSFDGWNSVSNATLQDNDPTNDLTPQAAQRLYTWQHRRQGDIVKPDYNIDAAFGGPFPYISEMLGDLRFFFSYLGERTMYLVPLSREDYKDFNTTLKITSDISPSLKLQISGMYGETYGTNDNNSGTPPGIFYSTSSIAEVLSQVNYITGRIWPTDYWAPSNWYRHMASIKLTYIHSSSTLAELVLQKTGTKYFTTPGRPRNLDKIYLFGNAYYVDEAPFGFMPYPSTGIDGLRMGVGMSNSRDYSRTSTYSLNATYTSQVNENNQIKSGVEVIYNDQDIQYGREELTLPTGNAFYYWRRFPIRGSFFVQDKLEFEGLIVNAGIRMDYSDPNGEWYTLDPYDPLLSSKYGANIEDLAAEAGKMVETERRLTFSPRLGISHPITEDSKLYFNYGHFRSMPITENLYLLNRGWDNSISRIANPNLPLAKTIQYELGYDHNLFDMLLLHVAAYYKDVSDQPFNVRYTSADSKINYTTPTSNSYEDTRGFEVTLTKSTGDWVYGFINYTYMVTTSGYFGYARYYQNPSDMRDYIRTNVYQEKPRPEPYARANIEFRTPSDFGPEFAGMKWLNNFRISILPSWSSGRWFTWNPGSRPEIQYNVKWRDYWNVNMRISKDFKFGKFNFELICDISNLFNRKHFTTYGFYDYNDYKSYMESLHLPKDIADALGAPYNNHYGNDTPGDYRDDDVAYDPKSNDEDTKAYIDMPNQTSFTFLNPRSVFWGLKIYFDF